MIRVHHTYCLLYFSCYQPHQLYLRSSDRPRRLGTLQHGFGMLCSLPLSSILWESLLSTIIRNTWMVRNIVISENEPTSTSIEFETFLDWTLIKVVSSTSRVLQGDGQPERVVWITKSPRVELWEIWPRRC